MGSVAIAAANKAITPHYPTPAAGWERNGTETLATPAAGWELEMGGGDGESLQAGVTRRDYLPNGYRAPIRHPSHAATGIQITLAASHPPNWLASPPTAKPTIAPRPPPSHTANNTHVRTVSMR